MTNPDKVRIWCKNCQKDVTQECLCRMDTADLSDGLVQYTSCPTCKSLTDLNITIDE